MLARYKMFAAYNAWCNRRLFDTAAKLSHADYRADRGAFFKSVHGTLNHLLVGDRIWMKRFTGEGAFPPSLDAIPHDEFSSLRSAREAEDARISGYVDALSEQTLQDELAYRTVVNPKTIKQPLSFALDHFSITRRITGVRHMLCSPAFSATRRRLHSISSFFNAKRALEGSFPLKYILFCVILHNKILYCNLS